MDWSERVNSGNFSCGLVGFLCIRNISLVREFIISFKGNFEVIFTIGGIWC